MNEMYDVALDGYGPPMEPPYGFYFLTAEQMAEMGEKAERRARESEEEYDDE